MVAWRWAFHPPVVPHRGMSKLWEPVPKGTDGVFGSQCVHAAFARLGGLLTPPITVMLA